MSILVNKTTMVITQGMTGETGTFDTSQTIAYATQMVRALRRERVSTMRWSRGFAAVAALLLAIPASAQLAVSPLVDIYESYNDCLKVAVPGGLKLDVLTSLGWTPASVTDKDGKPVTGGPTIFGHAKRKPIIFLSLEKSGNVCNVMARLDKASSFADFTKAWGGKLPAPDKDGIIGFFDNGHPVALRQTGTADKPSLTMSVMTPMEKK